MKQQAVVFGRHGEKQPKQLETRGGNRMNQLQKFIEERPDGKQIGRTAYAFSTSALPKPNGGFDWRVAADFSAAREISADADLKQVFEAAIKHGFALITPAGLETPHEPDL